MPSAPSFDLYEALEISKTASHQEIKDSYKRLALIHHPDKNPNDESATARFQRISLAHETLSDATARARYDSRSPVNPYTSTAGGGPFYDSGEFYFYDEDENEEMEDFINRFIFRFGRGRSWNDENITMRDAAGKAEEEARKRFPAERQAREEEAEAKRRAKAAAKKAEDQKKQNLKEKTEKEEHFLQEQLWEVLNATTEAQKQSTCLHSDFWPKEQQRKKFRCGSCREKHGMTGYKCPHCALLVCQLCLNKLIANRAAR